MLRGRFGEAAQIRGLFLTFGFCIASFFPFISLYYREVHGLSESEIGVVIMVTGIVRAAANPFWGHLADTKVGRLTVLQVGLVGGAIAALSLNLAAGIVVVAIVSAIHSAFLVAQGPNIDAISMEHLGDEHVADYGRIRGWESLTYATGCFAFGAILQAFGMRWAMPLFAISAVAVLLWSTTIERDRGRALEHEGRLGAVGAVFHEAPRFWAYLAAQFLVWTGFNAAWNFIGLKIDDAGGGPWLIGLGAAVGGLVELPTMRTSPRLQRRYGVRAVYVAGCAFYALGFGLWGSIEDPTVLSFLMVLEGVGFSLLFTSGVSVVGKMLPANLYSTGSAVSSTVGFGLGPIVGALVGGVVYEHVGPFATYAGASALALAAGVVALFALATPSLSGPTEPEPVTAGPETGPFV
jgi:MFS transporter, PPP family, 3-phenylpropionic acid transporter